jgi:hypothetical protein
MSHLGLLGRSTRVDTLVRRYHAHWVFYDRRVILFSQQVLTLPALQSNPNLKAVFDDDGTWVFRVRRLPGSTRDEKM